jgi:hypothetical protein
VWQGGGFSLDTPVSSTNKTDRHHITEILLKVALNTITLAPNPSPGTLVSSTNKTDSHDITEILLNVALNTKPLTLFEEVSYFRFKQ